MSKDLKDLIDEAEEEQESRAYLEKKIEKLKAEVTKLKNKLEAKQKYVHEPPKISFIVREGVLVVSSAIEPNDTIIIYTTKFRVTFHF